MLTRRRFLVPCCSVLALLLIAYVYLDESLSQSVHDLPFIPGNQVSSDHEFLPCLGPRGPLVSDAQNYESLDGPYPEPLYGSHDALGLPKTWSTAGGRYGPYGFGEDAEDKKGSKIEWHNVDWAGLQNTCVARNRRAFHKPSEISPSKRLKTKNKFKLFDKISWPSQKATGQTAIVLRTWDSYDYTQEDLYHLRAVISEAALGSGGRYAVYLLVDVKDKERRKKLRGTQKEYEEVIASCVPPEFRNMTVLFDQALLENRYPKVPDHNAEFQMYQALQLFAEAFPFDHYWQLEMDAKFLVNVKEYLDALSDFAYSEPREGALHRATYRYMPSVYPTYGDFAEAANIGRSHSPTKSFRRPKLPEIHPFNPIPSFESTSPEPLDWGADAPADLILTNTLVPVLNLTYWPYQGYAHGFSIPTDHLPRLQSPVSITRSSRLLLHLIHAAQTSSRGLALPSEATGPSFAWYHGLKISYPPSPFFMKTKRPLKDMEHLYNGGIVEDGGRGDALYHPRDWWDVANDGTWHWGGGWPREIMDYWLGIKKSKQDEEGKEEDLPWILHRDDAGRIWAPTLALHPVKTNGRR